MNFQFFLIFIGAAFALFLSQFSPQGVLVTGFIGTPAYAGGDGGVDSPVVGMKFQFSRKDWGKRSGTNLKLKTGGDRKLERARRKLARCEARLVKRRVNLTRARQRLRDLREQTKQPMNNRQARALLRAIDKQKAQVKTYERMVRDAERQLERCRRAVRNLTPR